MVTIPIVPPPFPATHLRCTQQRTQAAATNSITLPFISSFRALQRTAAWPPLAIPTTCVESARDWHGSVTTPAPTIAISFTSYSALQCTAAPSLAVPTTPVKPARDVNALTLTGSEGLFEHAFHTKAAQPSLELCVKPHPYIPASPSSF
ncbi:hypothetical protein EDB85DRAFT_1885296 [Lactarius pseudohatsudake]|nr:hypothetical protein EDB85DRAFT_1885296 [Lactarius pseudohatsudake]